MRVVFDTNVLVRAAMSPHGPASALLALLPQAAGEFVISTWILQEVEDVLRRPRLRQLHHFDEEKIRRIILDLDTIATRVVIGDPPSPPLVTRDQKGDPIILTALAGEAEVICTRDADLLDPVVKEHCAQRGIRVVTDLELLKELRNELE